MLKWALMVRPAGYRVSARNTTQTTSHVKNRRVIRIMVVW
ncbi:unnamed protein product [Anisakis simplex]|uniref:Uncharacterized protein n=1 Tax=Anisakis simplex TaxID=6269 RepID=A0A3P6PV01_ANISI|nr:unnamed protein product [Anisakis simplex]